MTSRTNIQATSHEPAKQTRKQKETPTATTQGTKKYHKISQTYNVLSANPTLISISHICFLLPNNPIDFTFKFDKSSLKLIVDALLQLAFGHKKLINLSMFSGGNNDFETVQTNNQDPKRDTKSKGTKHKNTNMVEAKLNRDSLFSNSNCCNANVINFDVKIPLS